MNTISRLLLYVFNIRSPNRNSGDQTEYARTYGRFKPTYWVYPWPPRNDDQAQRFYNHIRTVAWYLDAIPYLSQAELPIRIGIDDIVSAFPFYGDFLGVILAAYMVLLCWMFGVPSSILMRMAVNVVVDGLIGIIPVLGDILDALFKSNLRNLALLEDWLLKGRHNYNIQITPDDEFLPRKKAARPAKGFRSGGTGGHFERGDGGNDSTSAVTSGREKCRSNGKGTHRFDGANLDAAAGLDLD